jgi:hypothetical protein
LGNPTGLNTARAEQPIARLIGAAVLLTGAGLHLCSCLVIPYRWYIVANDNRTVHPELQRFAAKRMDAKTYDVNSSHVLMLSNRGIVIDVVRTAANSI